MTIRLSARRRPGSHRAARQTRSGRLSARTRISADQPGRLVEDLSDRKLEADASPRRMDDGETLPVRCPVCAATRSPGAPAARRRRATPWRACRCSGCRRRESRARPKRDRNDVRRRQARASGTPGCRAASRRSRPGPCHGGRRRRSIWPSGAKRAELDRARRNVICRRVGRRGRAAFQTSRPAKIPTASAASNGRVPTSRPRAQAGRRAARPPSTLPTSTLPTRWSRTRRELAGEVPRRGVAVLGVLGEAALDDPAQRRRHLRVERADRLGLLVQDRRQRVDGGLLLERPLARRHLVEDRAERELVRSEVDRLARSPAPATCSRPCPRPTPGRRPRLRRQVRALVAARSRSTSASPGRSPGS